LLYSFTKIAETQIEAKPPTPAQAKVKSMQQSIDRQKLALTQERERQQNLKQADKMRKLQAKASSF
jgi:hypothetical protein